MRFKELKYGQRVYNNSNQIIDILKKEQFYWLIDSEIEDASIEIKNSTLIWNDGIFMTGHWYYGIFRNGMFYGNWENGIFEGGFFDGSWKSGINLTKNNQ